MIFILVKNAVGLNPFFPRKIINGLFRGKGLLLRSGQNLAQPLSGISRALLLSLFPCTFLPLFDTQTLHQSLVTVLLWLVMSMLFELLFNRMIVRKLWKELFRAHTIITVNPWIFMQIAIAPSLVLVETPRGLPRTPSGYSQFH